MLYNVRSYEKKIQWVLWGGKNVILMSIANPSADLNKERAGPAMT